MSLLRADHLRRVPDVRRVLLALLLFAVPLGAAGVAFASPSPVTACPPCEHSFEAAAANHGVETEIEHSEAVVRVHRNGSATWTVRNRLANATAAERLQGNATLARAVAADSFGVRYGDGIDHELLDTQADGETFEMRYRTADVAKAGVGGATVLTYFRDVPGAYIYTELGADRLTIVAPRGTTVAHGFGERSDEGRRTTATSLPGDRDGPFVVFAPADHPAPGALGMLAVAGELWGVVVRNLALFVGVPGAVFAGGILAVHRFVGPPREAGSLRRTAGLVIAVGFLIVVAVLWIERPWEYHTSTQGWFTLAFGAALVCGGALATSRLRDAVTYGRLLEGAVLSGGAVAVGTEVLSTDGGGFGLRLALAAPVLLFSTVALGYAAETGDRRRTRWAFALVAGGAVASLAATAPVTELGGALFLLVPVLLTILAAGCVVIVTPLYRLGGALAAAESGE